MEVDLEVDLVVVDSVAEDLVEDLAEDLGGDLVVEEDLGVEKAAAATGIVKMYPFSTPYL